MFGFFDDTKKKEKAKKKFVLSAVQQGFAQREAEEAYDQCEADGAAALAQLFQARAKKEEAKRNSEKALDGAIATTSPMLETTDRDPHKIQALQKAIADAQKNGVDVQRASHLLAQLKKPPQTAAPEGFVKGATVWIEGTGQPKYNGQQAVLLHGHAENGRWAVNFPKLNESAQIRESCIKVSSPGSQAEGPIVELGFTKDEAKHWISKLGAESALDKLQQAVDDIVGVNFPKTLAPLAINKWGPDKAPYELEKIESKIMAAGFDKKLAAAAIRAHPDDALPWLLKELNTIKSGGYPEAVAKAAIITWAAKAQPELQKACQSIQDAGFSDDLAKVSIAVVASKGDIDDGLALAWLTKTIAEIEGAGFSKDQAKDAMATEKDGALEWLKAVEELKKAKYSEEEALQAIKKWGAGEALKKLQEEDHAKKLELDRAVDAIMQDNFTKEEANEAIEKFGVENALPELQKLRDEKQKKRDQAIKDITAVGFDENRANEAVTEWGADGALGALQQVVQQILNDPATSREGEEKAKEAVNKWGADALDNLQKEVEDREKGFNIEARLGEVRDNLSKLFVGDDIMINLTLTSSKLVHGVLQRGKVGRKDALFLFKIRLLVDYCQAANDGQIADISQEMAKALDELMVLCHDKATEVHSVDGILECQFLSDGAPLMLLAEPWFPNKFDPAKQSDRNSAMTFLSKTFNLVHELTRRPKEGTNPVAGLLDNEGNYDHTALTSLKNRLGCVHMALKLSGPTRSKAGERDAYEDAEHNLVRPCFVGQESIGKSTLVNYLINPAGDGRTTLPTGDTMCTAAITLVRHGDSESDTWEALEEQAKQIKKLKEEQKVSLETPVNIRYAPLDAVPDPKPEYIDSPGIREQTELDVAFAFGVSTQIILCVDDEPESLGAACEHGEFRRLKRLYQSLSSPPPLILAITKPRVAPTVEHDDSTFEPKDDLRTKFDDVVKAHFPSCPSHKVLYANFYDTAWDVNVKRKFVTAFHETLNSMTSASLDAKQQYLNLLPVVSDFLQDLQKIMDNNALSTMDGFERARGKALTQLENFGTVDAARQQWKQQSDQNVIYRSLDDFKKKAQNLPVFTRLDALMQSKTEFTEGENYLLEDVLMQSRILVNQALMQVGDKLFTTVWKCLDPFCSQFVEKKGGVDAKAHEAEVVEKRRRLAGVLAHCAELPCLRGDDYDLHIPEDPCDATNIREKEHEYKKWLISSSVGLKSYADASLFPWFLSGYYSAIADPQLENAMFRGRSRPGAGKVTKDDKTDITNYPNCTEKLPEFKKEVDRWFKDLSDKHPTLSGVDFDALVTKYCLEASNKAAEIIGSSDLLDINENPFVFKLKENAFKMAVRMMIRYENRPDEGPDFYYTPFAHKVRDLAGGNSLERLAQQLAILEKRDEITAANLSAISSAMTQTKRLVNTKEMVTLMNDFVAVKEAYAYHLRGASPAGDVFVGVFGDADRSKALEQVNTHLKCMGKPTTHTDTINGEPDMDKMVMDIMSRKPLICVFFRRGEYRSSEPNDWELKFLASIKERCPFVGCLIWLHDQKFDNPKWEKPAGGIRVHCITGSQYNYADHTFTFSQDAIDTMTKIGNDMDEEAAASVKARGVQAEQSFNDIRKKLTSLAKIYKNQKTKTAKMSAFEFYDEAGELMEAVTESAIDDVDVESLKMPSDNLFDQPPFSEKLMTRNIQSLSEPRIREFLLATLRAQIIQKGQTIGKSLYDTIIVQKVLMPVIGTPFGLSDTTLVSLIEEYVSTTSPKDDDGAPVAAAYLKRDNFVTMYVGGTVLAGAPMLSAMVGSTLLDAKGRPSDEAYKKALDKAAEYYHNMRTIGR